MKYINYNPIKTTQERHFFLAVTRFEKLEVFPHLSSYFLSYSMMPFSFSFSDSCTIFMLVIIRYFSIYVFRDYCVELLMLMDWLLLEAARVAAASSYLSRVRTLVTNSSLVRRMDYNCEQTCSYRSASVRCEATYNCMLFICSFRELFCAFNSSTSNLKTRFSSSLRLSKARLLSLGAFLLKFCPLVYQA